jgi:hypothetical protein
LPSASDFRESRLGSEIHLRPKAGHGSLRIVLAYPNLYYVGMSNLGFQGVHAHFNSFEEIVCERAFLPEEDERATIRTLTSFESGIPLRDFDVVAFSVAFENDYSTSCRCSAWRASRCARRIVAVVIR